MDTKREILLDPALDLATTVSKAKRVGERATKKGLSGGYQISTETRMETNPVNNVVYEQTYLIVEGSPAKYNGWTFLARVEWINNQPIVSRSPYNLSEQVDGQQLTEGNCDHCGIKRQRNSVIIVENEAGDRKQVGKSCAKDYLGHESPVAWFAENTDEFSDFGGYDGFGKAFHPLYGAMLAAATIVRQRGYVYAGDPEQTSTKDLVRMYLGDMPSGAAGTLWKQLHRDFDEEKDPAAAKAAFQFAENMQGTTEYVQSVKAVLSVGIDGHFDPKHMGLVVSLAWVYEKDLIKKATTSIDIKNEEFGKVGDKITLTIQTLDSHAFETIYGISYINTFTADGYRFKWFTGSQSWESGETFEIKGTIKSHEEYNGQISTVLTRCKRLEK